MSHPSVTITHMTTQTHPTPTLDLHDDHGDHGDQDIVAAQGPEQLSLLTVPSVPLQFRLDERTRRSGLEHVAALRAQMAAQAAARTTPTKRTRSANRQIAA